MAFALVQADLLRGKSIGLLPVKVHIPDAQEKNQRAGDGAAGGRGDINLVIDEWILLEYACVVLPAQQNAVVESVSKGARSTEETKTTSEIRQWKTDCRSIELLLLPEEFHKPLGLHPRSPASEMKVGDPAMYPSRQPVIA